LRPGLYDKVQAAAFSVESGLLGFVDGQRFEAIE
jgi:hypothetical protein